MHACIVSLEIRTLAINTTHFDCCNVCLLCSLAGIALTNKTTFFIHYIHPHVPPACPVCMVVRPEKGCIPLSQPFWGDWLFRQPLDPRHLGLPPGPLATYGGPGGVGQVAARIVNHLKVVHWLCWNLLLLVLDQHCIKYALSSSSSTTIWYNSPISPHSPSPSFCKVCTIAEPSLGRICIVAESFRGRIVGRIVRIVITMHWSHRERKIIKLDWANGQSRRLWRLCLVVGVCHSVSMWSAQLCRSFTNRLNFVHRLPACQKSYQTNCLYLQSDIDRQGY